MTDEDSDDEAGNILKFSRNQLPVKAEIRLRSNHKREETYEQDEDEEWTSCRRKKHKEEKIKNSFNCKL